MLSSTSYYHGITQHYHEPDPQWVMLLRSMAQSPFTLSPSTSDQGVPASSCCSIHGRHPLWGSCLRVLVLCHVHLSSAGLQIGCSFSPFFSVVRSGVIPSSLTLGGVSDGQLQVFVTLLMGHGCLPDFRLGQQLLGPAPVVRSGPALGIC